MTLFKWSQTASVNGTADSTCQFPEGMSPAAVNDGTRGMMAAVAKYRDDVAGAIVTGGTSTAYTVASFQVFDALAHLDGKEIAFTPHTTNGATVTLSIDGLGNKPLRSAPGVELPAGVLIQGTPYVALYNGADQSFYLRGFFGDPYAIPVAGGIDFWGATAPNSAFALMYGQPVSRTTYATLFERLGTTHGVGDGSTTFNIPDLRGRVSAGKDDMGGSSAFRLTTANFGTNPDAVGATGGSETKTLVTGNLPPYTPAGSISGALVSPISVQMRSPGTTGTVVGGTISAGVSGGTDLGTQSMSITGSSVTGTVVGTPQGGTSTPVVTVQPTIISNKIIRLI